MTFVSMYTTKNCLKSGRPITNRKIRYPLKYYFVFKNSKKKCRIRKEGFLNWIVINVITIFSTTLIKLQYNKVHLLAWSCKYFMYMNVCSHMDNQSTAWSLYSLLVSPMASEEKFWKFCFMPKASSYIRANNKCVN